MIGTKFNKADIVGETSKPEILEHYSSAAEWCTENDAHIEEDGEYYIVVANEHSEPSTEEKILALESAIQNHLDSVAHEERGYDNLASAISYASSTVERWATEAAAALAWRDAVWIKANELLNAYKAGTIAEMTAEEVIEQLPAIDWGTDPL